MQKQVPARSWWGSIAAGRVSSQLMVSNFSVSFPYHKVKVRVSLSADLGEDRS